MAYRAVAEPHLRAYLSAKGIRDIASGLFAAILIAYGSAHVLSWFKDSAARVKTTHWRMHARRPASVRLWVIKRHA
jgi:hypothetical protein